MNNIVGFFRESWAELKQVAWLTVPQMIASTWMVVILVLIMAAYVFCIDGVLQQLFKILL